MKKILVGLLLVLGACRGQPSSKPPLHVFNDMDWQAKFQPQEGSRFYPDERAMRPVVLGTVAQRPRGEAYVEDPAYTTGMVGEMWVGKIPANVIVDDKLMARGEQRYNIYCAPCHDQAGSGKGMVARRGFPNVRDLTEIDKVGADGKVMPGRVRNMSDGEIYHVIANGVRGMPSYRKLIPVADRWAIVAWVRVLTRAGGSSLADVPTDQQGTIESESGNP